jgi:hypothetical protein
VASADGQLSSELAQKLTYDTFKLVVQKVLLATLCVVRSSRGAALEFASVTVDKPYRKKN